MNLINKVKEESYIQWIEKFVTEVLNKGNIIGNEVVVEDVEFSKRILLTVDRDEYNIRTWSFHSVEDDENGQTCAEAVVYSLFKMVSDDKGSHEEEIDEGCLRIEWKNN